MAICVEPSDVSADTVCFPRREYDRRLSNVRARMAEQQLDAILVTKPENIYYLTGLNHQGFFAFHLLLVPITGKTTLVTRAMEHATVEDQVKDSRFVGYTDNVGPVEVLTKLLEETGLQAARLGIEKESLCFPPYVYEALLNTFQRISWHDTSWLIDGLRLIKSPLEIEYTRSAARVSDAMMQAALNTARPGVNERLVASEVHQAMIMAGGENPGFTPFIRPSPRIAQEHTTWRNREIRAGESLFLEMAGCIERYHAPLGRLLYFGKIDRKTRELQRICLDGFDRIVDTIRPGIPASHVYATWQSHIEDAGVSNYRRHHCGYLVGLGFPPSWTGGSTVIGLRHDSSLVLQPGMVFHLMSWLIGTALGDYFVSNCAVLTQGGCEVLTNSPIGVDTT